MKEDSEREAYSLEHYSLVNDFDLSPRGIWKLLHNFKLASDTNVGFQKVTLPAGRKAYSQGKRGGKRALQAVQFRDSGCVKSFYFLYSNALTSWGLAGLGDTAFP